MLLKNCNASLRPSFYRVAQLHLLQDESETTIPDCIRQKINTLEKENVRNPCKSVSVHLSKPNRLLYSFLLL